MNDQVLSEARTMICAFLKNRRIELNLTQKDLADLCGFHINTINNLEAARFWPNMKQFLIITHHLKCFFFLEEYEKQSDYSAEMKKHWEPGNPGGSITGHISEN
jgi:transcriptional regulator with XRE-family HTH domain